MCGKTDDEEAAGRQAKRPLEYSERSSAPNQWGHYKQGQRYGQN